jgi:hypothetical protein
MNQITAPPKTKSKVILLLLVTGNPVAGLIVYGRPVAGLIGTVGGLTTFIIEVAAVVRAPRPDNQLVDDAGGADTGAGIEACP